MKLSDITVLEFLRQRFPEPFPAHSIVRHTDLSFSTVRASLNRLYGTGYIERDLGVGLNGHTIHEWYWSGKEWAARVELDRLALEAAGRAS